MSKNLVKKILTSVPNIQIYPSDKFKIAMDALTQKAFEMIIDGCGSLDFQLVESHSKKMTSTAKISNLKFLNYKFKEFEYAVFNATISERLAGNDYTTAAIICRKLGACHYVTPALQNAVINSLDRMACIRIEVNMESTKKIYDSPIGEYEFRGYLLPTESLKMTINGQFANVIHFLSKGPIFVIAEMKDQILTCDEELMQAPVRTSVRSISINHFLLRRILAMKGTAETSKTNKRVNPLRHTILFDSLYNACDIVGNDAKRNARSIATDILTFFVEKNFIKGYSFEKGKAGKTRAIIVDFQPLFLQMASNLHTNN